MSDFSVCESYSKKAFGMSARFAFGAALAIGLSLVPYKPASAVPTVFLAEDVGAGNFAGMVNSTIARDNFVSQLIGSGVENFEGIQLQTTSPLLTFGDTGITGTISTFDDSVLPFVTNQALDGSASGAGRFATSFVQYLTSVAIIQIQFSEPIVAFGSFLTDCCETDNDETQITPGELDGRPLDTIDGIFRLATERPSGVEIFEITPSFPVSSPLGNGFGLFFGVIDRLNPFDNIILFNGTAGLFADFPNLDQGTFIKDAFGFDDMIVATAALEDTGSQVPEPQVPEPGTLALFGIGLVGLGLMRRRRKAAA